MGLLAVSTFAFVLWVALWAVGAKAFDAAMLAVAIVVVAVTVRVAVRYLPGRDAG